MARCGERLLSLERREVASKESCRCLRRGVKVLPHYLSHEAGVRRNCLRSRGCRTIPVKARASISRARPLFHHHSSVRNELQRIDRELFLEKNGLHDQVAITTRFGLEQTWCTSCHERSLTAGFYFDPWDEIEQLNQQQLLYPADHLKFPDRILPALF